MLRFNQNWHEPGQTEDEVDDCSNVVEVLIVSNLCSEPVVSSQEAPVHVDVPPVAVDSCNRPKEELAAIEKDSSSQLVCSVEQTLDQACGVLASIVSLRHVLAIVVKTP